MKSKISIDVDFDNQPIIKIEYEESPDVRDTLVKKFLETFEGDSRWAQFLFRNGPYSKVVNKIAEIRPIPPKELKFHHEAAKEVSDKYEDLLKEMTKNIVQSK